VASGAVEFRPISIQGLAEFQRRLRRVDVDLPKALRLAMNEAGQLVVDTAKPRVPQLTGAAAGSIRVVSTRTESRVRAGGAKVPYYAWLDFGGAVGRNKSVKRAFFKSGRYLWAAFAEKSASGEIQAILSRRLDEIASTAGIEMTG
jgi:hypothetical protein